MLDFLLKKKVLMTKFDSLVLAEPDITFNEFAALQLHIIKLYHVLMKSMFV